MHVRYVWMHNAHLLLKIILGLPFSAGLCTAKSRTWKNFWEGRWWKETWSDQWHPSPSRWALSLSVWHGWDLARQLQEDKRHGATSGTLFYPSGRNTCLCANHVILHDISLRTREIERPVAFFTSEWAPYFSVCDVCDLAWHQQEKECDGISWCT